MARNTQDFHEGAGHKALEKTVNAMGLGKDSIKDPFTGTVHVDLSDPKHSFWQPMWSDDKKDK